MRKTHWLIAGIFLSVFVVASLERKDTAAQGTQNSYITGLVRSVSSGRPVPSLWVMIYEGETLRGRSLTGDDGRYYVGVLDRKEYKLIVKRGNVTLLTEKIRLPQNERYDIRVRE